MAPRSEAQYAPAAHAWEEVAFVPNIMPDVELSTSAPTVLAIHALQTRARRSNFKDQNISFNEKL